MYKSCQVEECNKKVLAKNFCSIHYDRVKRNGTPYLNKPENFDKEKYKYCPKCKTVKELILFPKDLKRSDGKKGICKNCLVKIVHEWQKRNPEKKKLYDSKYKKNNKVKVNETNAKRRAIRKNAKTYFISKKDIRKLKYSSCFFCGAKKELSLDHIIPLNRGGTHGIGNIHILCISCNASKQDKLMSEWRYRDKKQTC